MTLLLNKEVQLRDLRHLASEIFELVRTKDLAQTNRHQVAELAQTAWNKLRDIGPLMDEAGNYFLALGDGLVERLNWDEVDGASPRTVRNMLDATEPSAFSLWWCLEEAEFCTEALYRDVKTLTTMAENAPREAERRWEQAEKALLAEGVLPVRLLAPSAVGGARYVREVYVPNYMAGAFRETLANWDAFIISRRPTEGPMGRPSDAQEYTISLELVDDQFEIGKFTVMQYYADLADEAGTASALTH